jgi:hypothetical protein
MTLTTFGRDLVEAARGIEQRHDYAEVSVEAAAARRRRPTGCTATP